jgi:hypothetical protein
MKRFFFHVRINDALTFDLEGAEFPDLDAARREAFITLGQIISDLLRGGEPIAAPQIEIVDQVGTTLATVGLNDAVATLQ